MEYYTVQYLVGEHKKLSCTRLGNRLLFRVETLQKYLEKLENDSLSIKEYNNEYGKLRKVRDDD